MACNKITATLNTAAISKQQKHTSLFFLHCHPSFHIVLACTGARNVALNMMGDQWEYQQSIMKKHTKCLGRVET